MSPDDIPPALRPVLNRLNEARAARTPERSEWDTVRVRRHVLAAVEREAGMDRANAQRTSRMHRARTWMSRRGFVPMSLIVTTVCVLGVWMFQTHGTPVAEHTQIYRTNAGERSTIRLRDGSTMLLAPATTVELASGEVTVAGEAYFTIAPRSNRPFVVRTQNAIVRVLGTRFVVRRYPADPYSRVVVEDGRVALSSVRSDRGDDTNAILTAHMMALVTDSSVAVSSGIATRAYTSWTQGILVFDRVPLGTVVDELVRAYGVDIRIADSALAKQTMRLEVSVTDDPLGRVLDVIGMVTGARYERKNGMYVLSPGRVDVRRRDDVPTRPGLPQPEQQYGR